MAGDTLLKMTSIDSTGEVAEEVPTDYPWHPGYLPEGFYLVQADTDNRGGSRLLFRDDLGGYVSLIIKADQALSPTSDIQSNDSDVPAAQSLTASPESPSPSVLDLDRVKSGNIFNLRLTSNLSPEELKRIADSID